MHYVSVIQKKEPVRPSELGFKLVRYDWLNELEYENEIYIKRIGENYTLLGIAGHEYKAEERINKEVLKKHVPFDCEKTRQKIKFDFTQLIEEWLQELPRIAMSYGIIKADNEERDTPYNGVTIEGNPLCSAFKKYVESLMKINTEFFLNPFMEQGEFDKKAESFIRERKELIGEIVEIIQYFGM